MANVVSPLANPAIPSRTGPSVTDARGMLVTPGWINGHTHSHEGFHRGRYDAMPL